MATNIAIIAACVQKGHNLGSHGGSEMRLLIAMMKHETNTFSQVPTPPARFGHGPGPLYGEAAIRAYCGTGTGLGAYLDLASAKGPRSYCRSPPARRRAARSRTP